MFGLKTFVELRHSWCLLVGYELFFSRFVLLGHYVARKKGDRLRPKKTIISSCFSEARKRNFGHDFSFVGKIICEKLHTATFLSPRPERLTYPWPRMNRVIFEWIIMMMTPISDCWDFFHFTHNTKRERKKFITREFLHLCIKTPLFSPFC